MPCQQKIESCIFLNLTKKEIHKFGVDSLALFGSVAKENNSVHSDLDILVEFSPGMKTYDNYIDLCYFLEDSLDTKVDLLTPEALSPLIFDEIRPEIEYVKIA